MQFLVIAHDATTPGTLDRRMEVRPRHLEELGPLVQAGRVAIGGVTLDENGAINGSMIVIEAESEDEVRDLIARDVYTQEGVWERVEIRPFRRSV